jgi:hypothetical protein
MEVSVVFTAFEALNVLDRVFGGAPGGVVSDLLKDKLLL